MMLSCKETSWLLSRSREQPLTWSERLGVRVHLWLCAQCRRFRRQLDWFDRLSRRGEADLSDWVAADLALSESARERIRTAVAVRRSEPPAA
jgi:hypothetical protein